jgi:hypothetical protein
MVEPRVADVDERYRVAMQQCDYLASEILAERACHARELAGARERARAADVAAAAATEAASAAAQTAAAARADAERLAHHLAHARAIIKDMERSRFWRMRLFWVRLRRRLGAESS